MGAISVTAISGVWYQNLLLAARWRLGTVADCRGQQIFHSQQTLAIWPSLRPQDEMDGFGAGPSVQAWDQTALLSQAIRWDGWEHWSSLAMLTDVETILIKKTSQIFLIMSSKPSASLACMHPGDWEPTLLYCIQLAKNQLSSNMSSHPRYRPLM
jgi:hypothetical protein